MFRQRSKILLIATLLATVYVIYLITYFSGVSTGGDSAEAAGGAIAAMLVTPHMALMALGAIFGWVGFLAKKSWGALVAAILYSVGAVLFFMYAMFSVPILILGFIGYAKQKKLSQGSVSRKLEKGLSNS